MPAQRHRPRAPDRAGRPRPAPAPRGGAGPCATAGALAWALLCGAPAAAVPVTRVSAPQADAPTVHEAWRQPGLRVALVAGPEWLVGLGDVPGGSGVAFGFAPGMRLSQHWSVGLDAHYVRLRDIPSAGFTGLRYSAGIGPTLHLGQVALSLTGGVAGLMGDWRPPTPGRAYAISSGTCDAQGGHLKATAGYMFVAGENFATGPLLAAEGEAVQCEAITSAEASGSAVRPALPWWRQASLTAMWSFMWR